MCWPHQLLYRHSMKNIEIDTIVHVSISCIFVYINFMFANIFQMVSSNLELVLQLWLTINQEPGTCNTSNGESGHGFDASLVPTVALSPASVSALMSCLAW